MAEVENFRWGFFSRIIVAAVAAMVICLALEPYQKRLNPLIKKINLNSLSQVKFDSSTSDNFTPELSFKDLLPSKPVAKRNESDLVDVTKSGDKLTEKDKSQLKGVLINFKKLAFLVFLVVFNGCAVPKEIAPVIAGEGGRVQLLQESISTVHKSVQWGDPTIAAEVVSPKIFPGYYPKMIGNPKKTRVMEVSMTGVEMDPKDENKATSTVEIQVYGSPTYSVKTLSKKESWEFSRMNGGWKLTAVEDAENSEEKY